jgi:hypothetical protein
MMECYISMTVYSKAIIRSVMTSPLSDAAAGVAFVFPFSPATAGSWPRSDDLGDLLIPKHLERKWKHACNKATLPWEKKQNEAQCASPSPQQHTTTS